MEINELIKWRIRTSRNRGYRNLRERVVPITKRCQKNYFGMGRGYSIRVRN